MILYAVYKYNGAMKRYYVLSGRSNNCGNWVDNDKFTSACLHSDKDVASRVAKFYSVDGAIIEQWKAFVEGDANGSQRPGS